MKLEYSFEKQKFLLLLEQMSKEELLEASKILVDGIYAYKDFIDSHMRESLGLKSKGVMP